MTTVEEGTMERGDGTERESRQDEREGIAGGWERADEERGEGSQDWTSHVSGLHIFFLDPGG